MAYKSEFKGREVDELLKKAKDADDVATSLVPHDLNTDFNNDFAI